MQRLNVWLVLLLLLTACDPGDVVLVSPENSNAAGPALTVRAVVDTPYVALAEALGWTAGVPGARVRVHKMDEPYDETYWVSTVTDSTGEAPFPDLLAGLYEVEVSRVLDSNDIADAGSTTFVLAGGRRMYLPSASVQEVALVSDNRGSLVFSEFGLAIARLNSEAPLDTKYFEVYNNADTTIYLDGKYWGIGWHFNREYPAWPCAQTEVVRNDPEGIWAEMMFRFPGGGTDYPLLPGDAALIAKAAIDHRVIHPDLYDLSHADFEWGGSRTADNPDVPNLEEIGLRPMPYYWPSKSDPEFLSEPVDLETLPRYVDPFSGYTWVRIPRRSVLDAWAMTRDWSFDAGFFVPPPACLEDMHRNFESLAGPAGSYSNDPIDGLSYQRRVLTVLPDGRRILQDTNTSMFDFVKAVRTPGWIP